MGLPGTCPVCVCWVSRGEGCLRATGLAAVCVLAAGVRDGGAVCLPWSISKKKADYLGKRGQERSFLSHPDRWRLVGLETLDGSVLPDGAYAVAPGTNANGQRNTQGRVTSTYFSPTLGRGIAMGLIARGPERMGEVVDFPTLDGRTVQARICDPVFYDKAGEKQNV